jgi:uncharacterized protein (DUF1778 family)
MKNANIKRTAPQLRVVVSLHLSRGQHATFAKAAKVSGESLAQFLRSAAENRAHALLGGPPPDAQAA